MARVGVDLDGVLYDFGGAVREWLRQQEWYHDCPEAERWEFYLDWGLSVDEFLNVCHHAADAGHLFRWGEPPADASKHLFRLKEAGHQIIIVTDRAFGFATQGKASRVNTEEWLAEHDIPFDEIHYTSNKASVDLDYMVDDKPSNVADLYSAGITTFLHRQAWNREVWHRYPVINSIDQYVDAVLRIEAATPDADVALHAFTSEAWTPAPVDEGVQIMAEEFGVPIATILDGEVRAVSSTGAEKGTKLARYDLVPAEPLRLLAEHYGRGSLKYADRNWEKGYEWSKSFAALNRHLWAFWNGEDIDPETGSPHMAAVAWHAFAMLEYTRTHPEFDDRPAPSGMLDQS